MRRPCRLIFTYWAFFCIGAVGHSLVFAQSAGAQDNQSEDFTLTTKDGVALKISYFPSKLGKNAVPIVMLHDFKESRAVFSSLARELNSPPEEGYTSFAVITVDLRGHGESTRMAGRNGQSIELEATRLKKTDFQKMVSGDMEAVRKFLVKKNDAGELNLNKLCMLGSGMGANVAAYYAEYDWSVPPLARRKQSQDVRALILASPKWSDYGLPMRTPMKNKDVREKLSVMIVYGAQDPRASKDAKSIQKLLIKYHPDPPRDQRREKKDFFMVPLQTRLQGTKLLTDSNFNMIARLDAFLDARLSDQFFDWIERKPSN